MIPLIFNVLYFLKMRPNFDVRYQIKPNCNNIFMAIFIDLWPCLLTTNSAKHSCSTKNRKAGSYSIWKVKHETISEWWKNSCRPTASQEILWALKALCVSTYIDYIQKYSRLRCLLRVKGLMIGFYLGWSGHTLLIRKI